MFDVIRRTVGLVAAVLLTALAVKYGWFDGLLDSLGRAVVVVALFVAVVIFGWTIVRPSTPGTIIAIILTACAVGWGSKLFDLNLALAYKVVITIIVVAVVVTLVVPNNFPPRFSVRRPAPVRNRAVA